MSPTESLGPTFPVRTGEDLPVLRRYGATALAAAAGVLGILVAAALFLGSDDAASDRFGILVGIGTLIVQAALATWRAESANRSAHRAEAGIRSAALLQEATTPVALKALNALVQNVERLEAVAPQLEAAATKVNGNGNGHGSAV